MNIIKITIINTSIISWIILLSNNPTNLILNILLLTIIRSLIILINITTWFSLILLLIYVGGIIVIFSYFVRLRSNDSIIIPNKITHLIIIPVIIIETLSLQPITLSYKKSQIYELYLNKNIFIIILITIILLIIIIIVIKIVKTNNGPLRGFNYL